MATNLYEAYSNPITGETFKCISHNSDSYLMEWRVQPQGFVPFEHIHYFQDETFTVKEGQLRIKISGKEQIVNKGETVNVPMGAPHIAFNDLAEELVCDVRYTPGLDYYTFMQCFIGLQQDKNYNAKGQINVPKMAYFMNKTKCNALARPTTIPAPMFRFVIGLFGIVGTFAGWNKQLKRYVG